MASTPHQNPTDQSDLTALKGRIPLLGLTGGIGSGKTTVSDLLGRLGAGVIDTDLIAHQITAPGGIAIPFIQDQFGAEFLDPSGALNRGKMRSLVFEKPEARRSLERITHPLIRQETIRQALELSKAGSPYLVFVIPLLVESGNWQGLLDHIAVVDCPEETQIKRVMERNKLTLEEVKKILEAQASRDERLSQANTILHNEGGLAELNPKIQDLHEKMMGFKPNQSTSS
jgi:dephospho-CoA kinase